MFALSRCLGYARNWRSAVGRGLQFFLSVSSAAGRPFSIGRLVRAPGVPCAPSSPMCAPVSAGFPYLFATRRLRGERRAVNFSAFCGLWFVTTLCQKAELHEACGSRPACSPAHAGNYGRIALQAVYQARNALTCALAGSRSSLFFLSAGGQHSGTCSKCLSLESCSNLAMFC